MSDQPNPVVPPVTMEAPQSQPTSAPASPSVSGSDLHPEDAANAAALADAGVTHPSQTGSFERPSLDEMLSRLRELESRPVADAPDQSGDVAELKDRLAKVEDVLRYLGDMYFREVAHKMAREPHSAPVA